MSMLLHAFVGDWILAFNFGFVEDYGKEGLEDGGV